MAARRHTLSVSLSDSSHHSALSASWSHKRASRYVQCSHEDKRAAPSSSAQRGPKLLFTDGIILSFAVA